MKTKSTYQKTVLRWVSSPGVFSPLAAPIGIVDLGGRVRPVLGQIDDAVDDLGG